jgi:fructokinase
MTNDTAEILVVGETIVDMHPDGPGSLADVETFHRRAGGAPANVAVGIARLRAAPALWTRLGDDGLGDFLAETLSSEGIPEEFVERDPDAPTGLALVSLDADADRGFSLYLDGTASTRLQSGRIDDERLATTDWLHVGGVELAHEPARSAVLDLLERAPPETTVSFDPNARPQLWTAFDYAETLETVLPHVDVLFASVEDLEPAGYEGSAEAVARAVVDDGGIESGDTGPQTADDAGPHTAIVTRGAAGALAYASSAAPWVEASGTSEMSEASGTSEMSEASEVVEHPGFEADAVDTTGAGDAFTAGAITALVRRTAGGDDSPEDPASASERRSLADALRFGNAVAAESTTAQGAMTALPARTAVETFLDENR